MPSYVPYGQRWVTTEALYAFEQGEEAAERQRVKPIQPAPKVETIELFDKELVEAVPKRSVEELYREATR